jgi:hypothetical protein
LTTIREYAMNNASSLRIRLLLACMMTAAMAFAAPAIAGRPIPLPPPDSPQIWAEGQACAFPLTIDLSGSKYHLLPFVDRDGNVRLIIDGKGSLMTVTNTDTGAMLTLKAYGFSVQETYDGEGMILDTITGHVMVINYPRPDSDVWTRLYVGKLVMSTDPNTHFSDLVSFSGKVTDICAALE